MTDQIGLEGLFIHPNAIVETSHIGRGTRVWAFAHILAGAHIGSECNICDGVFIENAVVIGDRVTIKCGVQLWDGVTVEDDVFIGPNATFTNDSFPRSRVRPEQYETTVIRKGASIGANATILSGLDIGRNAMVGAGSVVTRNVPPNAVVIGNPASIQGYVGASQTSDEIYNQTSRIGIVESKTRVAGVSLHALPEYNDMRGGLVVAEFAEHIPFAPKRIFAIHGVPSKRVRGEHAHRALHQFLVCIKGECSLVVDNGKDREEIRMSNPSLGVYLPPLIWAIQYKFTSDAVLLVFASEAYDASDYIRDYNQYVSIVSNP